MPPYPSRLPVNESLTESIPAGGSGSVEIEIPETWLLKSIEITLSGNASVDEVHIDGQTIGLTGTSIDLVAEFGDLVVANDSIEVFLSNSGGGAEDSSIQIRGLKP